MWWWLLAGIAALLVLAAFHFDSSVHAWIAQHQTPELRRVMLGVSRFGDWPSHVAVGVILLAAAFVRRNQRWQRIAIAMLLACALSGVVARAIKIGAGRARPSTHSALQWNGPAFAEKFHAFPSGHTAASAALFGVVAFVRPRLGVPLLIIPAVIAASRMYVAAHFLSDVICAFLLGLACAWVALRFGRQTN